MRRILLIVTGFSALLAVSTTPALAGYGALARDDETGKYGLSSSEESQGKADDVATKECGSDKCKIIFRIGSRQCGAIATEEGGNAWGAAWRGLRADAELAAMQDCQKHTKGQCKVRQWGCNR